MEPRAEKLQSNEAPLQPKRRNKKMKEQDEIKQEEINPELTKKEKIKWWMTELERMEEERTEILSKYFRIEPDTIVTIQIDLTTKPKEEYDTLGECTKVELPIMYNNQWVTWSLNRKNPIYRKLVEGWSKGQKTFKISRTGKGKTTRYNIMDEK